MVGACWKAEPYSYAEACALAADLEVSDTLASVLVRRGLREPTQARAFLDAAETHDPFEFEGVAEVAELALAHVRRGSQIAVHGDYDVDGVSSTAILVSALRALGADVRPRIPGRMEDGYGLSVTTVQELHSRGASLLITADCGITAAPEVARAGELGMDVIVSDHHRPDGTLPECPIVHPQLCGYPCADLCATGVAYKLAQAIFATAGRDPAELESQLDLVALATVADLVPLVGENRALVRSGLRTIAGGARPGLGALLRVTRIDPQSVDERTLGFVLAPRLNAAGRLYRADAALELLLCDDPARALEIARELDAVNVERQSVETAILFEAERLLSESGEHREDPLFVLAAPGWHPGVVGIVASRLVERHHRPCVLIALDEQGAGRGSGRSIQPYDLHAGLTSAAGHLKRFGGHRMAAGLEVAADQIEPLRNALVDHARQHLSPSDLVRTERVDAIVPGDAVCLGLAEELDRLRPFGMGNPSVNLMLPAARVSDVRPMGEGRHARFTVSSAGVRSRAVAFGVGGGISTATANQDGDCLHDVIAKLERNEWQGAVEPRLVLRGLHEVTLDTDYGCESAAGCAECACGARGGDWWRAVLREVDAPLDRIPAAPAGAPRTVVDRRGEGALGVLAGLLTTGESVLVACADVSRRRGLFARELSPARFSRPEAVWFSPHCSPDAVERRLGALGDGALALADHDSIAARPELLERFSHIFVLDPPPFEHIGRLLRGGAPVGAECFTHLAWGPAELDFARGALEHELSLRATLAALYRQLAAHPQGLQDDALERALRGEGRHPRSPALAGRCLRVLVELGLTELERSSATVKCTIISRDRVELERSHAYSAYGAMCQQGLRFLSTPTHRRESRQAA